MIGLKDLLASERGWFCLFVVILAFVLVFLGKIVGGEWIGLVKFLGVTLIASKTLTNRMEAAETIPTATVVGGGESK